MTVELYDPAEESGKPQITLSEYLIHLELQQAFDPKDYLEQVNVDQMTYEKERTMNFTRFPRKTRSSGKKNFP